MATATKRAAGRLHVLTARGVQAAGDGDHGDGGGLLLRVRGDSAAWVLRYTSPAGRRRELGLGRAERNNTELAGRSLVQARDQAHEARALLRQGTDPIEQRERQRQVGQEADALKMAQRDRDRWTLARAAREYHERVIEPSRSPKHAAQWIASLENHVPATVWHRPVDTIEPAELLKALIGVTPHERARNHKGITLPETVRRLRQRLEAVFEDAIFHKRCASNPAAAVKRKLRESAGRQARGEFRALPYREAPSLMARVRSAEGVAARCLEFTVLCAARTSEVLLATWSEFDLDNAIWIVPKERMKTKEVHTVFLSERAVEVLRSVRGLHATFVFPSLMRTDRPLSNMAMLTTLGRLGVRDRTTVHGLARASFSTWANETGAARPDVIEACLAHEEGNRVRASYNRAKFNGERVALMRAWSEYLARQPAAVLDLKVA